MAGTIEFAVASPTCSRQHLTQSQQCLGITMTSEDCRDTVLDETSRETEHGDDGDAISMSGWVAVTPVTTLVSVRDALTTDHCPGLCILSAWGPRSTRRRLMANQES
jgi:hypothetical protein